MGDAGSMWKRTTAIAKVIGAIVGFVVLILTGVVAWRTIHPPEPPRIVGSLGCHYDPDPVNLDKLMSLESGDVFRADLSTSWEGVVSSKSVEKHSADQIVSVSSAADLPPGEATRQDVNCSPENSDPFISISTVDRNGAPIDGWESIGHGTWVVSGRWEMRGEPIMTQGYYFFTIEPAPEP